MAYAVHTDAPYSKGKDYSIVECTYALPGTSRQVGAGAASNQRFTVTITGSCSWTAVSDVTWLTIASGESTTSSDVVYFYNANMATAERIGIITVGDRTYTVTQAGRPLTPDGYEGATTNNTVETAYSFTPVFYQNTSTITISPASCHNAEDVDYYKINLPSGSSYKVSVVLHDLYRPINNSNYTLNTQISCSINGTTWSDTYRSDTQLPNLNVSGGVLYLRIEPWWNVGSYAAKIDITAGCYSVLPETTKVVTSSQGIHQINVTTGPSCSWMAIPNDTWITITSAPTTGSGSVHFSYTENTTTESRTATITVGDQTYTVTQAAPPDGYESNNTVAGASELNAAFTPSQNLSTINISPANCHSVEDVDYYKIHLETGYSYSVSAVLYDWDSENNRINTSHYTLDAKISYSIDSGAYWSYAYNSRFSNETVPGGGDIYLKIEPHYGGNVGSYAAKIDIKRVAIAGCSYTLSANNKEAAADADSDQITVTPSAPTCYWAAFSDNDWITITSGASGTGTGIVSYSYNANMATWSRTGTILVGDRTYIVTQAGRSLTPDGYEGADTNNTVETAYPFTPTFTQNTSTITISPASCHNIEDVDYYKINLASGSSYKVSAVLYGYSYYKINNSNYTLSAKISYSIDNGTTWNDTYDTQFSDLNVLGGVLYLKIEPYYSGGLGSYAAKIDILKIAADCTYNLSSMSKEAASAAGSDEVTVTTSSTCPWAVVSNDTWITITSASTTGTGSIQYSYTENTERYIRTGTITIAGQTYTVTQSYRLLSPDGYEPNNTVATAYSFTPTLTQNTGTITISPANCHTVGDVDYYKINLASGYSYTVSAVLYDWDNKNNKIGNNSYTLDAQISYLTNGAYYWSYTEDVRFSNVTVPGGDIYLKIEPYFSGYVGSYAVKVDIKRVAVAGCTSLSANNKEATTDAGSGQITVTRSAASAASCFWAAFSNDNWITITSVANTTNPGSVSYSYNANMAVRPRTGTIMIGDQTYTVTQEGRPLTPDGYEPNNTVAEARELTAAFTPQNVSTINISPASCHESGDVDYYKINLAPGYFYTVDAVLYNQGNQINNSNYTLSAKISYSINNGNTWSNTWYPQFSDVTVPGETLYLKIEPYFSGGMGSYAVKIDINKAADACSYSLSPASIPVPVEAGNGQIIVTTGSTCDWTATSDAAWLTITPDTGTGGGTITYTYTANTTTTSRIGTITVGSQTFVVTQSGIPCSFTFAPISANIVSALGTGSLTVTPTSGSCAWQATSDAAWLTVTPDKGTGGGDIIYTYTANTTTVSRLGTITVGSQTFVVTQSGLVCSFTIAPISSNVSSALGTGSITVTPTSGSCSWQATSDAVWLTVSPDKGTGGGDITYTYTANTTITPRIGTITVGSQTFAVTQAGIPCSFTFAPISSNVVSALGTGSVTVTPTSGSCSWQATSDAVWLTITPDKGTGGGDITYTYTENTTTTSRLGRITVGSQTFVVTQSGLVCSFTIAPISATVSSALGTGSVTVTSNSGSCVWQATSDASWLTITPDKGTGDGTITYAYTENTATASRLGTITVGSQTFVVTQSGLVCSFTIAPISATVSSVLGTGSVTVTPTSGSCTWQATSDASWLTITPDKGTGDGTITYAYTENTATASRLGTITVGSQTFVVTQSGIPCSFTFAPISATVSSALGTGSITVTPTSGSCVWQATSDAVWLTVSPDKGTGGGDIYTYTANTTTASRLGTITVGSQTFVVTQSGIPCSFTFAPISANVSSALGTGSVTVTPTSGSCTWQATSDAVWLTITPDKGTGGGDITYTYTENTTTTSRLGRITVGSQTFVVTQSGLVCSFTIAPISATVSSVLGTGSITVTPTSGSCVWQAISDASWLTITPDKGTGDGTITYTYTENTTTVSRLGTITVGSQTFAVTQSGLVCSFTFLPISATVSSALGTGSVTVTPTSGSCVWQATSDASWLTITPDKGTGGGDITYTYTENTTTTSRLGRITVGSQTFVVTQSGLVCSFTIAPISATVSSVLGTGSVTVTSNSGSCVWQATSDASWLTVSPDKGTGGGDITYTYTANTTTTSRLGTITVGSQTFVVTQSGIPCSFTIAPISATVSSVLGTGSVTVTPNSGSCSWQAISDASWLTITPDKGTGDGTITYTYTENTTTVSRLGTITVGSQTFAVTQSGLVCSFTFLPISATVSSALGTGSVTVTPNSGSCVWQATSDASWLTVSPDKGTGDGTITYAYTENTATASRLGTITVGSQTFVVTQSGIPCSFTVAPISATVSSALGTGSVTVTPTSGSCVWQATSDASWLTITPDKGTGDGTITYAYTENTATASRLGTITVGSQTFAVTQAGIPCSFTFLPISATVASALGTGSVTVTPNSGSCVWQAISDASWLTVSPDKGTGGGDITYTYTENTTTVSRLGTITVGSQTFVVTQSGIPCSFTFAPISANVVSALGGTGSVTVTPTSGSCTWQATSDASWLTITPSTGTGDGTITYTYTANTATTSRAGKITIAGQIYAVTQAAACTYSLTKYLVEVTGESSTGAVEITTQSSCSWTAIPNVEWITVTPASGTGNGQVSYSIAKNTGAERIGTITIAGKFFTVKQTMVTGFETISHVQIFPNPAKEYVTLDFSLTEKNYAVLKIVNVFGQVLYERENPQHRMQIPLKGLSSGLYFIILQGGEKAVVQKLMVE